MFPNGFRKDSLGRVEEALDVLWRVRARNQESLERGLNFPLENRKMLRVELRLDIDEECRVDTLQLCPETRSSSNQRVSLDMPEQVAGPSQNHFDGPESPVVESHLAELTVQSREQT